MGVVGTYGHKIEENRVHGGKFRRPKMQALETQPLNVFRKRHHQRRLKRNENLFIPNCPTIPIIPLLLVTYYGPIIMPESREIKIVIEFLQRIVV